MSPSHSAVRAICSSGLGRAWSVVRQVQPSAGDEAGVRPGSAGGWGQGCDLRHTEPRPVGDEVEDARGGGEARGWSWSWSLSRVGANFEVVGRPMRGVTGADREVYTLPCRMKTMWCRRWRNGGGVE
jgi:hypothetical protein